MRFDIESVVRMIPFYQIIRLIIAINGPLKLGAAVMRYTHKFYYRPLLVAE